MLKDDQTETATNILFKISAQLADSSAPKATKEEDLVTPESWQIRVNALFLASLALNLIAVLLAMLGKAWVRQYTKSLLGITKEEDRAKLRHHRFRGVNRWHMDSIISFIPISIHFALLIFFCGLADLLFNHNRMIALIATSVFAAGVLGYIIFILLAATSADCPYQNPISHNIYAGFAWITQKSLWARLVHSIHMWFLSKGGRQLQRGRSDVLKKAIVSFGSIGGPHREKRAVKKDPKLGAEAVDWLISLSDFHFKFTLPNLSLLLNTALPSTFQIHFQPDDVRNDVPWMDFLTGLVANYTGSATVGDVPERNVIAQTLVRAFAASTAAELNPELEAFHDSMIDWEGHNDVKTKEQRLDLDICAMWCGLLALGRGRPRGQPESAWKVIKDIHCVPPLVTIVVLEAHQKWMDRVEDRELARYISDYQLVVGQLHTTGDPTASLEVQVAADAQQPPIAPLILESMVRLLHKYTTHVLKPTGEVITFLNNEAAPITEHNRQQNLQNQQPNPASRALVAIRAATAYQDNAGNELVPSLRASMGWIRVCQTNSIIEPNPHMRDILTRGVALSSLIPLSLLPINRLLLQSTGSTLQEISKFLDYVRVVFHHTIVPKEIATNTMTAIYWLWNQNSLFKDVRNGINHNEVDESGSFAILRTLVAVFWNADKGVYPLRTHTPISAPNMNLHDYDDDALWYVDPQNTMPEDEEVLERRCKTIIVAAEHWRACEQAYRNEYLAREGQGPPADYVGLIHSWVFSIFARLSPDSKASLLDTATSPRLKAALTTRWQIQQPAPQPAPQPAQHPAVFSVPPAVAVSA